MDDAQGLLNFGSTPLCGPATASKLRYSLPSFSGDPIDHLRTPSPERLDKDGAPEEAMPAACAEGKEPAQPKSRAVATTAREAARWFILGGTGGCRCSAAAPCGEAIISIALSSEAPGTDLRLLWCLHVEPRARAETLEVTSRANFSQRSSHWSNHAVAPLFMSVDQKHETRDTPPHTVSSYIVPSSRHPFSRASSRSHIHSCCSMCYYRELSIPTTKPRAHTW